MASDAPVILTDLSNSLLCAVSVDNDLYSLWIYLGVRHGFLLGAGNFGRDICGRGFLGVAGAVAQAFGSARVQRPVSAKQISVSS